MREEGAEGFSLVEVIEDDGQYEVIERDVW